MVLLSACGGGGSAATNSAVPEGSQASEEKGNQASEEEGNPSSIATESEPVGPRVDLVADGYLPFASGSTWSYSRLDSNGGEIDTLNRSFQIAGSNSTADLLQYTNEDSSGSHNTYYVKTRDGLYVNFDGSAPYPSGASHEIGYIREYAFPFYAEGENRVIVREGTWDEDIDGDGKYERYRFEYTQVYRGLESLALPWNSSATAARLTNSYRLIVTTSKSPSQKLGSVWTQEEYLAKGIGTVKIVEHTEDLLGNTIVPTETFVIKSATINGITHDATTQPASGFSTSIFKINLTHNDLAYDAVHDRYYASIPSSSQAHGNTIASIDPQTGAVTYSADVGGDPSTLTVSADGKYLYVGLVGATQVVKLALPSLSEVARIELGSSRFDFGETSYAPNYAESIAVSPVNSDIVAISLWNKGMSPRHAGVILVNGTTIAPDQTSRNIWNNLVTFNSDGSALYGLNMDSTGFQLRPITITPNGLTSVIGNDVPTNAWFGTRNFQYVDGKLYIGIELYSTINLSLIGQFNQNQTMCRPMRDPAKAVCLPSINGKPQLTVFDTSTFVALSYVPFSLKNTTVKNLSPGAKGMVAISYGQNSAADALYLFKDPNL